MPGLKLVLVIFLLTGCGTTRIVEINERNIILPYSSEIEVVPVPYIIMQSTEETIYP